MYINILVTVLVYFQKQCFTTRYDIWKCLRHCLCSKGVKTTPRIYYNLFSTSNWLYGPSRYTNYDTI